MAIILKSIKPGRHFRIIAYKPDRGPGYVVATEVIIERAENGRIVSYSTELFNPDYPTVRVNVEGRMTLKSCRLVYHRHYLPSDIQWLSLASSSSRHAPAPIALRLRLVAASPATPVGKDHRRLADNHSCKAILASSHMASARSRLPCSHCTRAYAASWWCIFMVGSPWLDGTQRFANALD